jgi:toxin HigB-1
MTVRNVVHRGLWRFILRNDPSGLAPSVVERVRNIVTFLQEMEDIGELNDIPGWRAHRLTGDRKGTWSLTVTRNWRITFRVNQVQREIVDLNYEDYHWKEVKPMIRMTRPSNPGQFIRMEVIEPLNLSVTEAARILGVTRSALSAVLNGRAAVSPEMALRIEKAFGPKMDTLLRMQTAVDIAEARDAAAKIKVRRYVAKPAPLHQHVTTWYGHSATRSHDAASEREAGFRR